MNVSIPKPCFNAYIEESIRILRELPFNSIEDLVSVIRQTAESGRQIFIFGNGGGAANASHFALELAKNASKRFRIRVQSLNDNIPWITAIANDAAFEDVFLHQLSDLSNKGDLAIILSTSGKSRNVIKPVEWAKQNGVLTACMIGNSLNDLQLLCDYSVVISSKNSGMIENVQLSIIHMMVELLVKETV